MKKLFFIFSLVIATMSSATSLFAQNLMSDKQIEREAKKATKKYTKEGWLVMPGVPTIQMQQTKLFKFSNEMDADGNSKYVSGHASSKSMYYDPAKFQATELAKTQIAGNIASTIMGLVSTEIANSQEGTSHTETAAAYASTIAASLTNIISCVEMYRLDKNTKMYEVDVTIFYNKENAVKAGVEAVRKELKEKTQKLAEKVQQLSGLE